MEKVEWRQRCCNMNNLPALFNNVPFCIVPGRKEKEVQFVSGRLCVRRLILHQHNVKVQTPLTHIPRCHSLSYWHPPLPLWWWTAVWLVFRQLCLLNHEDNKPQLSSKKSRPWPKAALPEHGVLSRGQSTKEWTEENKEKNDEREHTKKMSQSQVVNYMLCCNAGICAPTDFILPALKQPDGSWAVAGLAVRNPDSARWSGGDKQPRLILTAADLTACDAVCMFGERQRKTKSTHVCSFMCITQSCKAKPQTIRTTKQPLC